MGTIYSYYITQRWDDKDMPWWPLCGFGHRCLSKKDAMKELERQRKADPKHEYNLYRLALWPSVKDYELVN